LGERRKIAARDVTRELKGSRVDTKKKKKMRAKKAQVDRQAWGNKKVLWEKRGGRTRGQKAVKE